MSATNSDCAAVDNSIQDSPCLRLRGLPFDVTEDAIRAFFVGYAVVELHLMRKSGRNTGQAYVVLESAEAAASALCSLHMRAIGLRYIEVFRTPKEDVEAAAKAIESDQHSEGFVVRLRGLPYTVTHAQVATFLAPAELENGFESVHLLRLPHGRPTGEAYVEMKDQKSMDFAVQQKHKQMMGRRYIEVFQTGRTALAQAFSPGAQLPACAGDPNALIMGPPGTQGGMMMRPTTVTAQDLTISMAGLQLGGNAVAAPAGPHHPTYIVGHPYTSPGYPSPPRGPLAPMVTYSASTATAAIVPGGAGPMVGAQPVLQAHPGAYMTVQPLPPMQPQQQVQPLQQMHAQHQHPGYFVGPRPGAGRREFIGRQQQQLQQLHPGEDFGQAWVVQGYVTHGPARVAVSHQPTYPVQDVRAGGTPTQSSVATANTAFAGTIAGRPSGAMLHWSQDAGGAPGPHVP